MMMIMEVDECLASAFSVEEGKSQADGRKSKAFLIYNEGNPTLLDHVFL